MKKNRIVNDFLENQNNTFDISQQNLYSKERYQKLLEVVLDVLKKNKHADISEIRDELFKRSGLEEKIKNFFLEKRKAPGGVISLGTNNYQEQLVFGNIQDVTFDGIDFLSTPIPTDKDSLYDLGSCTKLFTSIAILQLAGKGELKINNSVGFYIPEFESINDLTIFDLLTYAPLITETRIDKVTSKEEAEKVLHEVRSKRFLEAYGQDRYNDIAPMVLKYIVEKVSGMPFEEYIEENILRPLGMYNTFVQVPKYMINDVANSNYSIKIDNKGEMSIDTTHPRGIATDKKAVIMGQPDGKLSGHAGLFSNVEDMVRLSRGLIDGTVLNKDLVTEMARNRTQGCIVKTPACNYQTTYGFLCNSKNPNKFFTEVHHGLSGKSFSLSGYPGTYIQIDPLNKINVSFLTNRTHSRIVSIPVSEREKLRVNRHDVRVYPYHNYEIVDSSIYGYERREITEACTELAIQERMLEELIGKSIDKVQEKNKVRLLKK